MDGESVDGGAVLIRMGVGYPQGAKHVGPDLQCVQTRQVSEERFLEHEDDLPDLVSSVLPAAQTLLRSLSARQYRNPLCWAHFHPWGGMETDSPVLDGSALGRRWDVVIVM